MTNKCESCPRNCCLDFKITRELTNSVVLQEELKNFPFVKCTGSTLILDPHGYERIVGVYNCERFDFNTGQCLDYGIKPRPEFCENTGTKFTPHSQCVLKLEKNERKQA